jgi:hypothetical protein
MAIVRWDPFGELGHLQDRINHAFDAYGRSSGPTRNDEGLMTTGADRTTACARGSQTAPDQG